MESSETQLGSRAQDRRGSVWIACDRLAQDGAKPTLSKIRPLHRGGSDTDVQADIQAWFAEVFKRHSAQAEGLGLPKEVAALMRGLWDAAQSSSDAQLNAQREELERKREGWLADNALCKQERDEVNARAFELELRLAAEQERSTAQARVVADLELRLAEAQSEFRQARGRADRLAEEIAANETRHGEAMWQLREEAGGQLQDLRNAHSQELAALRAAHAEGSALIRSEHASRMDEYERQHKLAEERHRGLEKNLLMEIDRARTATEEWKRSAQSARLEASTKETAIKMQNDALRGQAATLSGELKATNSALADSRRELGALRIRLEGMLGQAAQAVAEPASAPPLIQAKPQAAAGPAPTANLRPPPGERVDESDHE